MGERVFEGELGLYVECTWRLEAEDAIVCGSGAAEFGPDEIGRIRATTSASTSRVRRSIARWFSNYSLFTPDAIFTVGPRSTLLKAPPSAW